MKSSILLVQAGFLHAVGLASLTIAGSPHLPPDTESALLTGKWQKVRDSLLADDSKAADAVVRFAAGHACLATNRNNEALLLFLSLDQPEDLKDCLGWATTLAVQNQSNSVAHYLLGDALARGGRIDAALAELTKAIECDQTIALAWSARGALRAAAGSAEKLDEALVDLVIATRLNPELADAHASLGAVYVLNRAAEGALQAFHKALDHSPQFALAYLGEGCAYYGQGEFDEAIDAFQTAERLMPVLIVASSNQAAVLVAGEAIAFDEDDRKPAGRIESRSELSKMDLTRVDTGRLQDLVRTYGPSAVQDRICQQRQLLGNQLRQDSQWFAGNARAINRWGMANAGLEMVKQVATFGGLGKTLGENGFKAFRAQGALALGKAGASAGLQQLQPTAGQMWARVGASSFAGSSAGALSGAVTELGQMGAETAIDIRKLSADTRYMESLARLTQVRHLNSMASQVGKLTTEQSIADSLGLRGPLTPPGLGAGSTSIPGYHISMQRPLTEARDLVGMIHQTIPTVPDRPRRALLVGGDTLRTDTLDMGLRARGFDVLRVPPTANLEVLSRAFHADVITGVKPVSDLQQRILHAPTASLTPIERRLSTPPVAPPVPVLPRQQPIRWDWGKPFVPTNPAGPGGIDSKQIARTFVEKHEWPVTTLFTLGYPPPHAPASKPEDGADQ